MQNSATRPQVAAIVSGLVRSMEEGREPYIENRVYVVPHCFRVWLHDDAYEMLEVHFPRLRTIAEKELNARLQVLREKGMGTWWQRLWSWLQTQFFQVPATGFEVSALGKWEIGFVRELDASLPLNYLEIEASFSSIGKPLLDSHHALGGDRTKRYSFMVQGEEVLAAAPIKRQITPASVPTAPIKQTARLSWVDPETHQPQSYVMTTPYLALGRYGAADAEYAYQPVLRLMNVPIEISRVHGYLRFDAEKQVFQYQNVGKHETIIQPPAVQTEGEGWQTLAPRCKLCLGGKLFIQFERI